MTPADLLAYLDRQIAEVEQRRLLPAYDPKFLDGMATAWMWTKTHVLKEAGDGE